MSDANRPTAALATLAPRLTAEFNGQADHRPLSAEEGAAVLAGLRATMSHALTEAEMHERGTEFLSAIAPAIPAAQGERAALAKLFSTTPAPTHDGILAMQLIAWNSAVAAENQRLVQESDREHHHRIDAPLDEQAEVAYGVAGTWFDEIADNTRLVNRFAQGNRAEAQATIEFERNRIKKAEAPVWAKVALGELSWAQAMVEANEQSRAIRKPHLAPRREMAIAPPPRRLR